MSSKTAPLQNVSFQELYNVVCGAASQNPAEMRAASERLKELLEVSGTCNALQEIALQKTAPLQVRQLSLIQFKNLITNRWRSRKIIADDERPIIKTRCMNLLEEEDDLRTLRAFYAVIKEFSQMSFGSQAATMAELVERFHATLTNYYIKLSENFSLLDLASLGNERTTEDLMFMHIIFKCLANVAAWLRKSSQKTVYEKYELWVVQANASPSLIDDSPDAVYPIRFLVQGMVLFKDSLAQWVPVRKDGSENVTVPVNQALPKEFVDRAVTVLVTNFIPLKPSDLEGWMADPEEWVNSEEKENEQWVFQIRPCAERVLLTFANQYTQYVAPLLVDAFNAVVYGITFNQWLDVASSEVNSPNTDYLIVKRRIAWLIGKWVGDKCASPNDVRIWQILVHLLQDKGTGTEVVRLTAAAAVRDCVDALGFDPQMFSPFLGQTASEILQLIGEAETLERNTNGEDYLFKGSIMRVVAQLVSSAKEDSASLSVIVVPLLRESLSPSLISHLDEDALSLWSTALRNTNTIEGINGGPGLIDLVPLAISLLAGNLDLLGKITTILESYYLLGAGQVVQRHAADLFTAYRTAMDQAPIMNIKCLAVSLILLFQMAPPATYAEALHTSGLFSKFMTAIVEDDSDALILTHYITLMARIAIADQQMFLTLMAATATLRNTEETVLWEGLLDQWWRRFDNMYEPRTRKLSAMGIASLVSTGRREVLERLHSEIFNLWMDVLGEVKETLEKKQEESLNGQTTILTLYWDQPPPSFYSNTEDTPEFDRRKASYDNDPVRTTPLAGFLAARLQQAEAACGGPQVMQTEYLAKADPIVVKSITEEVFGRQ
ncbi:hypothetical protein HETIRDRAFT_443980 [Heterobasidion irregulare TC 32-1]|uniref:Importin N-terminal domain-containing protein n=1 Tax=Heterobasidion irregulare (strain TC 32-1) TaxID=747525 RepID=W4KEY8_HETIT|nr:uncharacterized protein HETIRDRAFT_443980 [Heterobasidion irregulare TC 32-1]ETW83875.1 hypothetical protein HETIRDRAFT_443980 [Heterobasidion irregulare TC 32-1]